jgi:hypothetical protein
MEVTMVARAANLTGLWIKDPQATFAGKPTYDQQDFRDPFVIWNPQAKAYWMVLASRQKFDAVIALYTSPDFVKWTVAAPLYSERSPLNLEVPDLFSEGDDWFIVFSDQREEYRLVRYLTAPKSDGKYEYGRFNDLDGRAFYAGRTAGTGRERLLFGWVAHKELHKDSRDLVWGGDLVAHAVRRAGPGVLAVSLPDAVARQFTTERAAISSDANADRSRQMRRCWLGPTSRSSRGTASASASTPGRSGKSVLELDTAKGEAAFLYRGQGANAPRVAFPRTADGRYVVDLVIDAETRFGSSVHQPFSRAELPVLRRRQVGPGALRRRRVFATGRVGDGPGRAQAKLRGKPSVIHPGRLNPKRVEALGADDGSTLAKDRG